MYTDGKIYMGLADSGERVYMNLPMCNRHGLIAGASGTGKTITMKCMAESFSDAGVPVFLCDIKGDVSGLCQPGETSEGMEKRIDRFGIRDIFRYQAYPTTFWDVYGEQGHPVRATISDMGPDLLSRIMGLTDVQEGILHILFRIADDKGLLLIDIKDLRALIGYVDEHKSEYINTYGNITSQSLGAIARGLLQLENQGGDQFFGEPALDIKDWVRSVFSTDGMPKGMINILSATKLATNPKLYSMFLVWMMSELFETMPEVGDAERPRLIFFFDEAHMLFKDTEPALVAKIEQVVKLIRSKGIGIYFVTQNPADIPDAVLAQCSNRVQHALRAYTPAEQKAVRAAAQSFRANPNFKTEEVIMELGTGEALTSFLDEAGVPTIVEKTKIICPQSLMARAGDTYIASSRSMDGMDKYDQYYDAESAYEVLAKQAEADAEAKKLEEERAQLERERAEFEKQKAKEEAAAQKAKEKEEAAAQKAKEKKEAEERRKAERRKAKIESQLISAGGQVLKRGLLNTLKKL